MKKKAKLKRLIKALGAYEPEKVYVIGSWARGEEDELSDYDLVVIKETPLPFFDRLKEVGKLLSLEAGGIDILVYTPQEWEETGLQGNAFAHMIIEEGQIIYDKQKEK